MYRCVVLLYVRGFESPFLVETPPRTGYVCTFSLSQVLCDGLMSGRVTEHKVASPQLSPVAAFDAGS